MSIDQYMATIDGVEYVKWEYHKNVNGHLLESARKVMAERDELKAEVERLKAERSAIFFSAYDAGWCDGFDREDNAPSLAWEESKWKSQTGGGE